MGQSVKLKIAGKEYSLTAASEEQEQLMRLAAKDVNEMLDRFNERFVETDMVDKFAFVAVQEAVGKFYMKARLSQMGGEISSLSSELEAYLGEVDKR